MFTKVCDVVTLMTSRDITGINRTHPNLQPDSLHRSDGSGRSHELNWHWCLLALPLVVASSIISVYIFIGLSQNLVPEAVAALSYAIAWII